MNYTKLYNNIIAKAVGRKECVGYFENHHIVPRSLGGTNECTNLVELTPREHFICHYLLAKMYQPETFEWYKMNHAFLMMKATPSPHGRYFNSHLYESLRSNFSAVMSDAQLGNKNSQYNTRWIYNNALQKSKKIPKNDKLPNGWFEGRKLKWAPSKKECKKCKIEFEYTSHNKKFCSNKCKAEHANIIQTKKDAATSKLVDSIAFKYGIVYNNLIENSKFIIEASAAGISPRKICHFLKCNDSGGNYYTIRNIISN